METVLGQEVEKGDYMSIEVSRILVATAFGLVCSVAGVFIVLGVCVISDYIAAHYYKGSGWYNPMWIHYEGGNKYGDERKQSDGNN